MMANKFLVSFH